jgi:hypothetical protein
MGMLPTVNRNYFNPIFFTADAAADLEPREEVLIYLKSSNFGLYKYFAFVDSMLAMNDKTLAIRLVNWHGSKKIQITKGMSLDDVFSCPFIESQFCVINSRDLSTEMNHNEPVAATPAVTVLSSNVPEDCPNAAAAATTSQQQQQPQQELTTENRSKHWHRRWINRHYVQ